VFISEVKSTYAVDNNKLVELCMTYYVELAVSSSQSNRKRNIEGCTSKDDVSD